MKLRKGELGESGMEVGESGMERKVQLVRNPFAVEKKRIISIEIFRPIPNLTTYQFDLVFCCSVVNDTNTSRTVQKKIHLSRHTAVEWKLFRFQRFDTREV